MRVVSELHMAVMMKKMGPVKQGHRGGKRHQKTATAMKLGISLFSCVLSDAIMESGMSSLSITKNVCIFPVTYSVLHTFGIVSLKWDNHNRPTDLS